VSRSIPTNPAQVVRNFALHYDAVRTPLVLVIADAVYPGLWRVRTRDGCLSDMVNLARAKDVATLIAMRDDPALHDATRLHWKKNTGDSLSGARRRVRRGGGRGNQPSDEYKPARQWGYRTPTSSPGKPSWSAKAREGLPPRPDEPLSVKSTGETHTVVGAETGTVVKADLSAPEAAGWIDGYHTGRARVGRHKGGRR
jgi:hypothetical protein